MTTAYVYVYVYIKGDDNSINCHFLAYKLEKLKADDEMIAAN